MRLKKIDAILSRLYAVFGGFTFFSFAWYFIKLVVVPEGTLPWIATILVMSVVGLPFIFRRGLRVLMKRAYLPFKAVICFAAAFFSITFAALVGYIYLSPSAQPDAGVENGTVYLVFGAKINSSGPTLTLAARLDAAFDAMASDPDSICIVSGGQGADEVTTEAECMKEYLIGRGISEERIVLEDRASNTAENIRFSAKIMKEKGLYDRRLICVSSDTHIPRIRLLCEREGIEAGYIKADSPKKNLLYSTWVREYLSYCKLILIGY